MDIDRLQICGNGAERNLARQPAARPLDERGDQFARHFVGEGVQIPSHPFNLLTDLTRRPGTSPLEEKVLHKMGNPAEARTFMPRSHSTPDADGHSLRGRHRAAGHAQTVGKSRDFCVQEWEARDFRRASATAMSSGQVTFRFG